MRRLLVLALLIVALAGCGSSGAAPKPSAVPGSTALPVYVDKSGGVTVSVLKVITLRDHALLSVSLRNARASDYQSPSTVPFRDTAFVEPNNGGSTSACDADESRGSGLSYLTVPAHGTNRGWIRCDYPAVSHLFVLIWQAKIVGTIPITAK